MVPHGTPWATYPTPWETPWETPWCPMGPYGALIPSHGRPMGYSSDPMGLHGAPWRPTGYLSHPYRASIRLFCYRSIAETPWGHIGCPVGSLADPIVPHWRPMGSPMRWHEYPIGHDGVSHGAPWGPMGMEYVPHGAPWGPGPVGCDKYPVGQHGAPWGRYLGWDKYPMGFHGAPWDPMGFHGVR